MFRKASQICFLVLGGLILLSAAPGFADTSSEVDAALDAAIEKARGGPDDGDPEATAQATESTAPAPAPASGPTGPLSKLSVHGFLTQAWADANFTDIPVGALPDGSTGPLGQSPDRFEESLGIPEDGTTNYRDLALQFRYDMTDEDIFVVQFSSRTLGESPLQESTAEVALDWAFYERRLSDNTSLKVGRVQIPFGIYNELRDVGTVLPFYRPSFVFYKEGAFTSETVDGLSLAHTFFAANEWNLEASVYAGEWDALILFGGVSEVVRSKDAYGYQLWLNSPWDVRLGTGLVSFVQDGGGFLEPINGRRDIFHLSLDATLGRFMLQAEYQEDTNIQVFGGPGAVVAIDVMEWYILAGFQASEKLRIFAQAETAFAREELVPLDITGTAGRKQREDSSIALNYSFNSSTVLKAEYHWTTTRSGNRFPDFSTGAFRLRQEVYKADNGSYSIVALAVSF